MITLTSGKLHVSPMAMASGSGGGNGGPPKNPKLVVRFWNWLKAKWKKMCS